MNKSFPRPELATVVTKRERLELIIVALFSGLEALVALSTLGFIAWDLRGWILFSAPDWLIKDD